MFAEGTKKAHFDAGFELTFGWDFYNKLKDVYNQNISVTNLENVNVSDYQNVPPGSHILRFTTNHDFNAWEATPQEIFNGLDASVTAFAVTAYMGGVPMFYNGQEVGYPNQLPFFEGASITIDWAINPDILEEYTRLVEGRKNSEALKNGSLEVLSSHQDVLVFKRVSGAEQVLFIANVRGSAIDYPLPESVSNTSWTNVMEDADVDLGSNLQLAAHQYVIVKNF
jgi:glycosidase